MVNKVDVYVNL